MRYPLDREERRTRNRFEMLVMAFYVASLLLVGLTENVGMVLFTIAAVPVSFCKPVSSFIWESMRESGR